MVGSWWFGGAVDFTIDQSVVFDGASNPELSLTYTLDEPWTFSAWIKISKLGSENLILGASGGEIHINADGTIEAEGTSSTVKLKDPTGWYHIHVSNNGIYVNGSSVASCTTTDLSNAKLFDDFDGYVAEVALRSGTVAVTEYGETSNNVWIPKQKTGGEHYLTFANSSALGTNSGSGSNWTATNIASTDVKKDSPTNNMPTFNILSQNSTGNIGTFAEGCLKLTTANNDSVAACTMPVMETGCYWEAKVPTAGTEMFGLWVISTTSPRDASTSSPHLDSACCCLRVDDPGFYNEGSRTGYTAGTISNNDILQFAYKDGQFFYGRNNSWENSGNPASETGELFTISSSSSKIIVPIFGRSGGSNVAYELRFSSDDWTYSAPSGYEEISAANQPNATITTSGSFNGNANAEGVFVYLNGVPTAMTINSNAVTFGTHVNKTSGGFKLITSNTDYNDGGSNSYSVSSTTGAVKNHSNAQVN